MVDEEWDAWVDKHASVFGLEAEVNVGMFGAWREVFEVRGYTASELNEATIWIAANDPPRFRSEHLAAIHRRIGAHRLVAWNRQREMQQQREAYETCPRCRGTALVIVPHLACVKDRDWIHPWHTHAVACNCKRGAMLYENFRNTLQNTSEADLKKKPWVKQLMSIGDYEMQNPGWISQMARKDVAQRAEANADRVTRKVDEKMGQIDFGKIVRVKR